MPRAYEPIRLDEAVRQYAPVVRAPVGDDADLAAGQPHHRERRPVGGAGGDDLAAPAGAEGGCDRTSRAAGDRLRFHAPTLPSPPDCDADTAACLDAMATRLATSNAP